MLEVMLAPPGVDGGGMLRFEVADPARVRELVGGDSVGGDCGSPLSSVCGD